MNAPDTEHDLEALGQSGAQRMRTGDLGAALTLLNKAVDVVRKQQGDAHCFCENLEL